MAMMAVTKDNLEISLFFAGYPIIPENNVLLI